MICIDSDFLVAVLRGNEDALSLLSGLEGKELLVTTAINHYELLYGALVSPNSEQKYKRAKAMLSELKILVFDQKSSELASRIYANMMKKGRPIGQSDLYIACIALSLNIPILTRNTKDFRRILGLKVIEW